MADEFENNMEFEDIRSSSTPTPKKESIRYAAQNYGNGVARHLDKVIKAISFIVALCVLLIFVVGALILVKLDKIFSIVALCVLIVGILLALIILFLIYAIGHLISQNNEIIRRL